MLQIEPVGFATMTDLNLLSRNDASTALTRTREEIDSVQTQVYTLAKTFSEITFETDRVESKSQAQSISLGKIRDTDIASEYTSLAKSLIVQEATDKAMVHSKVSAKNVFNLLI